nr:MiaB/RimO family radical SAM methylthiotransferase [Helicobacter sp.]
DIIIAQAQKAIDDGAKEILLLGQNVNSYGKTFSAPHPKVDFTKLLSELATIPKLRRIRFTSPHPLHMNDTFLDAFARNDKICKSIHMPLQSGSTKILKLMRRGYTQEWFLERAKRLREMIPNLTIGTDIIVGFPHESEEDFLQTMHVLEEVRFDTMYSFIYSPRPHTEAAKWENDVPHSIASERLARLQERQKEIMDANNQREIGKTCETLWEIPREDGLMEGRSDNAKIVRAPLRRELIGQISAAKILDSRRTYLIGEAI